MKGKLIGGIEPMKWKSRKFWMAVVSGILVVLNEGLGWDIPEDTVLTFVFLILGWIFAEAAVDVFKRKG